MYKNRTITSSSTLLEALKKMDELDKKLLIVFKNSNYCGLISIGDIQRAIIKNEPLDTSVDKILRPNIRVARDTDTDESVKKMMLEYRMELCPVLDSNNNIIKVYYWEDFFGENNEIPRDQFNVPVIIMAGGIGSRLQPLTYVLPKPLIPLGKKTMLEHIFQKFNSHGCNKFHLSVNYKADLIEYYIREKEFQFSVDFFKESKPLGTAGSLTLLRGELQETFFVSNCDILIEQDYSEILKYHNNNNNELTVIAALKNYAIPYGTIETGENGELIMLDEKPELTYKINSGMYILEPHLLQEIPENITFHITDLIEKIKHRNGKVGVFPVSEKSWKDVGEWDTYLKNINP